MTQQRSKFRHILTAVGAVVLGACEAPASNIDETQDQPSNPETSVESETSPTAGPTEQLAQSVLSENISSPESYSLEWSARSGVCSSVLEALNIAHSQWNEAEKSVADLDYAEAQATQYLNTEKNVQWRAESIKVTQPATIKVAAFDFFNDGIERRVVRMQGNLAGNKLISLGILEANNSELVRLSFGHAGIASEGLPDTENLHSKLTYSVADVIKTEQGFHTLIMPLADFDPSGRIYLASWKAKDGTEIPRRATDYYAALSCVFLPTDETATSSTN